MKKSENTTTTKGELLIDTMTLLIAYDADRTMADMYEIRKAEAPIREKMRSSRKSNIYVEYYKPRGIDTALFTKMVGADLARYGFSDVEVVSASSYRKKAGLVRSFLESIFAKVAYSEDVLPLPKRGGARRG